MLQESLFALESPPADACRFSTSLPTHISLFYDFPKATTSQRRYMTVNVMPAAQVI